MNTSLWDYNESEVSQLCETEPPSHRLAKEFIQDMNGEKLLDLYLKLYTQIELKVVARVALRKWLEKNGADYFHWCRRQVNEIYKVKNPWIVKSHWLKQIGEGSFSKTHLLLHKSKFFVLKLQKLDICNKDKEVDLKEIKILQSIRHENVLTMFESGVFENRVWILLEYANSGTLRDHIETHTSNGVIMTESQLNDCYIQILKALDYIHTKCVIHRDIKATNIFIFKCQEKITYKLGDFNLSRVIDPDICSHAVSYCGTIQTMAPETLSGEEYRYNADVWSFLCVVLFTLTGNCYNPISWEQEQVLNKIPEHYKVHYRIRDFVVFLHKKNPQLRPSARQCLNFFSSQPRQSEETTNQNSSSKEPVKHIKPRSFTEDNILCRGVSFGIPKEPKGTKKSGHFIRKRNSSIN